MCVPPLGSDCPIGTAGTMSSPNQQRRMIVNGSLVFEFWDRLPERLRERLTLCKSNFKLMPIEVCADKRVGAQELLG